MNQHKSMPFPSGNFGGSVFQAIQYTKLTYSVPKSLNFICNASSLNHPFSLKTCTITLQVPIGSNATSYFMDNIKASQLLCHGRLKNIIFMNSKSVGVCLGRSTHFFFLAQHKCSYNEICIRILFIYMQKNIRKIKYCFHPKTLKY